MNSSKECFKKKQPMEIKVTGGGEAWYIDLRRDLELSRKTLIDLSQSHDMVPSEAFLSFREASEKLNTASASNTPSPGREKREADTVVLMQQQWVEVGCLLRLSLSTAEQLQQARKYVEAALAFDAALEALAQSAKCLKGALFQALTAGIEGQGTCPGAIESSEIKQVQLRNGGGTPPEAAELGLTVDAQEWVGLQDSAASLRKLVRIKVQDDNDLKAARGALNSCSDFFSNLELVAKARRISEIDLVQKELL